MLTPSNCTFLPFSWNFPILIPSLIILILGSIGNIIVIAIIIKKRKKATADLFYYLIGNLAVYDLLLLLFSLASRVIIRFTPSFGRFFLSVYNGFPILLNTGFSITMVMTAVDRFWVIICGANSVPIESRKYLMIVFIFLVALGYSSPVIAFSSFTSNHIQYIQQCNTAIEVMSTCLWGLMNNPPAFIVALMPVYIIVRYLMIHVIPLIVVVILYSRIWNNLRSQIHLAESISHINMIKAQKNVIIKMFILTFIFLIACSPEYIVYLIISFDTNLSHNLCYERYRQTLLICQLISNSKSCINTLIYFTLIPGFKKSLLDLLCYCRNRSSRVKN